MFLWRNNLVGTSSLFEALLLSELRIFLSFSVSFDSNLAKDTCDSDDSDEELPVGLTPIRCGIL